MDQNVNKPTFEPIIIGSLHYPSQQFPVATNKKRPWRSSRHLLSEVFLNSAILSSCRHWFLVAAVFGGEFLIYFVECCSAVRSIVFYEGECVTGQERKGNRKGESQRNGSVISLATIRFLCM